MSYTFCIAKLKIRNEKDRTHILVFSPVGRLCSTHMDNSNSLSIACHFDVASRLIAFPGRCLFISFELWKSLISSAASASMWQLFSQYFSGEASSTFALNLFDCPGKTIRLRLTPSVTAEPEAQRFTGSRDRPR